MTTSSEPPKDGSSLSSQPNGEGAENDPTSPGVSVTEVPISAPQAPSLIDRPPPHPDWIRSVMTFGFCGAYVLGMVGLGSYFMINWDLHAKEQLTIIASTLLAPLGSTVGVILGFYFAERNRR